MKFIPAVCSVCSKRNNGIPPCIQAQRKADKSKKVCLRSFESPAEGGLCGYHAVVQDLFVDIRTHNYVKYDGHSALQVLTERLSKESSRDVHSKKADKYYEYYKKGNERYLAIGGTRYWIIRAIPQDPMFPQVLQYFKNNVTVANKWETMGTKWTFDTCGGVSGGVLVIQGTWGTIILIDPEGHKWRYRLVIAGLSKSPFKAGVNASPEMAPSAGFVAGFGGDLNPHSFEGTCRVVDVSAVYWAGPAIAAVQAAYKGPTDYAAYICMIGLTFGFGGGVDVCEGKLELMGRATDRE
jgi:hypothetical protein